MFLIPRFKVSLARGSSAVKACLDCVGPVLKTTRHSKHLVSAKNRNNFEFARFFNCSNVNCKEATAEPNSTNFQIENSESADVAPSEEFIKSLSKESQRLFQILRLELEVIRQSGYQVPDKISDEHWTDLLQMKTKLSRMKFYRYLFVTEQAKKTVARKKAENRLAFEKVLEERKILKLEKPFDGLEYGLTLNTIFLRLEKPTKNFYYNTRLCQALMFGQKLVVDMGYANDMVRRESVNCADQMAFLMGNNREDRSPFNLYLCNFAQNTDLHRNMLKAIPNLYEDNSLINVTEKSYLDLFPKEKLVYLTPDCRNDMQEYDHDSIYIIGGLVDKRPVGPLSLAKAKKEGLRMARLPVEKYIEWKVGHKSFTLDQMMMMLLTIKNTGDWNKAFSHIPQRKLRESTASPFHTKRARIDRLFGPR